MLVTGIAAVAVSSIAFGFLPICIRTAIDAGMNTDTIVCFRFLFASLVSGVCCLCSRRSLTVTRQQLVRLLFFGVAGFGVTAFLLAASYRYMPVGLATMFHFCYPVFVAAGMAVFFKERLSALRLFSVCIVLFGLLLMVDLSGAVSVYGTVLALLSGITYAVYITAAKKSVLADMRIMPNIFYVTFFSAVFFFVKSLAAGSFTLPQTAAPVFAVFIAGCFCTVFSLSLLTWGIRRIGATRASVINMIEPVTSIIAGALLYGERLDGKMLAGCCLVIAGTIIISLPGRLRMSKRVR